MISKKEILSKFIQKNIQSLTSSIGIHKKRK